MITSLSNKSVKEVLRLVQKAKARKEQGLFVVEGVKMFEEAPADRIGKVYVSSRAERELLARCGEKLSEVGYETVADEVFCKMSDTMTPQGVLCLVRQYRYTIEEILGAAEKRSKNPMLLLLEDIQDPGNLGTLLRTAEGAGVDGILMSRETVDVYNPKTIRSTMGSVYRVPFAYVEDLKTAVMALRQRKITVYAAHLSAEKMYDEYDYTGGTAFLVGNEGNGLRQETIACTDAYLKIPMQGKVESLNAAVAASVLMYEAYRQRRTRRQKDNS